MILPSLPPIRAWHRRLATRAAPVAVFEALYGRDAWAFLYESLEAHGTQGRYSFIGGRPRAIFRCTGDDLELSVDDQSTRSPGSPLAALRRLLAPQLDVPPVAPFCGGAVGYLAYDTVRWTEAIPDTRPRDGAVPDACLLFPREVICFDHLEQVVHIVLFDVAGHERRLAEIRAALDRCDGQGPPAPPGPAGICDLRPQMSRGQFVGMVARAKEFIRAGDVFQVVLSQRFEFPLRVPPLAIYKALRITNPSPYMYYLRLGGVDIAGSSPEVLVRLTGRRAVTRPLAGTRRRGNTPQEDEALAVELRADPKENAEHVMLVDLGRNDLGRVCEFGSIKLTDCLQVERHSKVMHLVSNVEGWLRDGLDALDLFQATFPAGTVSGAPKVRAMEIIEELEPVRRGIYAGAIGYFSLLGDMDLCIAIRTVVMAGGRGLIQAGAGIVDDSIPDLEYEETLNKARALMAAVDIANRSGACPRTGVSSG
jgi:anthranilate synthase component 1